MGGVWIVGIGKGRYWGIYVVLSVAHYLDKKQQNKVNNSKKIEGHEAK